MPDVKNQGGLWGDFILVIQAAKAWNPGFSEITPRKVEQIRSAYCSTALPAELMGGPLAKFGGPLLIKI